jgi:hypothetical protein
VKTQLEVANWSTPVIPCPLVDPFAMRAPNIIVAPPRNASAARLAVLEPKRPRHVSGRPTATG